jgi:hypothetical protein
MSPLRRDSPAAAAPRPLVFGFLCCLMASIGAAGCRGNRTGGGAGAGAPAAVELGEFVRAQIAATGDESEAASINNVSFMNLENEDEHAFDDLFGL